LDTDRGKRQRSGREVFLVAAFFVALLGAAFFAVRYGFAAAR